MATPSRANGNIRRLAPCGPCLRDGERNEHGSNRSPPIASESDPDWARRFFSGSLPPFSRRRRRHAFRRERERICVQTPTTDTGYCFHSVVHGFAIHLDVWPQRTNLCPNPDNRIDPCLHGVVRRSLRFVLAYGISSVHSETAILAHSRSSLSSSHQCPGLFRAETSSSVCLIFLCSTLGIL
jgi:hypothetical protein